jgi:TonB family protein
MRMQKSTNSPQFEPVEPQGIPWTRWAASLAINSAIIIALILMPVSVNRTFQPAEKVSAVSLIAPPPLTAYTPKPRPQIVRNSAVPVPEPARPAAKQFQPPVQKAPEPHVKAVKLVEPAQVEVPKPVETAKFEAPRVELPRHDVFAPAAEAQPNPPPPKVVKTGGFGDPNGVAANESATKASAAVQAGAFDLSPGTGHASGSGVNSKVLVAAAGFGDAGNGGGAATGANGHGAVHAGGFGDLDAPGAPSQSKAAKSTAPVQTPVEITFKPKPAYTPEAREKKVEGDVQLEVLFSSAGQIQVLRLIRGLGYGLDESARQAASQIRFRPGTRNGTPVDITGTVHIIFQIS